MPSKKRKQKDTVLGIVNLEITPGSGRGGRMAGRKKKKKKNRQSCVTIEWPDDADHSSALSGGCKQDEIRQEPPQTTLKR